MSEPQFTVLDELGAEFERAIARHEDRGLPRLRTLALTLLATLLVAGVAAAATYLVTGSPIPGAHSRDVPREATPREGTARLMGLDASDPAGGLPWDIRVSRSRTGQLCTAVGQVSDGRLGIVGLDGRFRAVAPLGHDTCGQLRGATPVLLGARVFDAPRREDVRTVVSGVAGAGVTGVIVDGGGEPRTLQLGPEGTFITVFAGYPEDVAPTVRFAGPAGRTIALAPAADRPRAADPEGGAPWTVTADERRRGARAGQTCAQVERERDREGSPGGMSYPVCGDLRRDPFFFELAPLPRAAEIRNPRQTFAWGFATPRTMLWGAAGADVERVTVVGPSGRTEVDLSATGPGFVAAFPAGTRPAELTVEVALAGGAVRRLVGAQNLRAADGRALAPALRDPAPIPASLRRMTEESWLVPEARTERIARRLADPAGGSDWAVRTFTARVRATGRRLRCAQLGRLQGEALRGVALDDPASGCVPLSGNRRREPVSRIQTFVDDASAYAPRPLRTVVWGTAGPGGRRVEVAGPAGVQQVPLGEGGAFLAFFAPELTDRDLVVRTTYADGHRHSVERFRSAKRAVVPDSERIEARAPDPDGGAPYGLLVWRTAGGQLCQEHGRIVGDTIGSLDARSDAFHPYPVGEGGNCSDGASGLTRAQPLSFSLSTLPGEGDADAVRRTLPGRTLISGTAHPAVREITIQTPRDVRTLRPASRSRAFLAVYDGGFFSGTITVVARLDDGTSTRHSFPVG